MGNDDAIHRRYFRMSIPRGFSVMDVRNTILEYLSNVGVVFDIEDGNNPVLFGKLKDDCQLCLTTANWPRVRAPYSGSPALIEAVKEIRSTLKLPYMDCVM